MSNQDIEKKKQLRRNLTKRIKSGDKNFTKLSRSGIKEIQDWMKSGKQEKFDIKNFQVSSKGNHWKEKVNIDDMFEVVIEVYGSYPYEKNWIKVLEIKNLTNIDLDINTVEGRMIKKEIVKDFIKKIEDNYGQEINNKFSEIERLLFE